MKPTEKVSECRCDAIHAHIVRWAIQLVGMESCPATDKVMNRESPIVGTLGLKFLCGAFEIALEPALLMVPEPDTPRKRSSDVKTDQVTSGGRPYRQSAT